MERTKLKRSRSANCPIEDCAVPPLTFRPKPSLDGDTTSASLFFSASSSSVTSVLAYGSKSSSIPSSPLSRASGQSCVSSPLSSIGEKFSNSSSPSMAWSSSKDFVFATRNSNGNESTVLSPITLQSSKRTLCEDAGLEVQQLDVQRASSWSKFLETSGQVQHDAAERKHMVDLSQLFVGQKFACGTYSRLYRGQYKQKEVAVKLVRQPDEDEEIANMLDRQFGQEVSLLSRLHHHNIVEFVGAMKTPPVFCVITEYLAGGSLRAFLHRYQPQTLPMDMVLTFALDIARGMEYLHSQGVLHLDLKSHNLVLGDNLCVKVTDFGVARLQSECESMTPDSGTYRWMAPEMISMKTTSTKADVYSFGIILWELVTGQSPYEDMSTIQAAFAVVHKNVRPPIPDQCPRALKQLMEECWASHPEKRPNFWQIVQRLEEFKDCLCRNESFQSWQFNCEKRTRFWPLLQKLKTFCFFLK